MYLKKIKLSQMEFENSKAGRPKQSYWLQLKNDDIVELIEKNSANHRLTRAYLKPMIKKKDIESSDYLDKIKELNKENTDTYFVAMYYQNKNKTMFDAICAKDIKHVYYDYAMSDEYREERNL